MALIVEVRGFKPVIGENCFLAPNSTVIGQVTMGNNCSVWFGTVVRGDVNSIDIGNNVNIQDNAVIHGTYEKSATKIGDNVSIAHSAVIHGCTIHNNVLIGMGAIVMDDAVVESNSIVAAGAVVLKNTVVQSGTVWGGNPAKKIKEISVNLVEGEINRIANSYGMYAGWYKNQD